MSGWVAFGEQFIVAEKKGEVLAVLRYRTASKWLLLGLLVADPWAEERPLAVALYTGAVELARDIGVGEVVAWPVPYADYPYEAGYRRRARGWGWIPPRPRKVAGSYLRAVGGEWWRC